MEEIFSKALESLGGQSPLAVFLITTLAGVYTFARALTDRKSKPPMEERPPQQPWIMEKVLDELRRLVHLAERNNELLKDVVGRLDAIRNDGIFRRDRTTR